MKKKLLIVSVFAAAMLAACGGDGNSNVSSLRKSEPAQTQVQAQPTPQVQVKEVEKIVTQMATVVVNQPVEVTRQVVQYVEVTPQPVINGFDSVAICDPNVPQPTAALDDADRAAGVVQRGQWCVDSFNKAVRP